MLVIPKSSHGDHRSATSVSRPHERIAYCLWGCAHDGRLDAAMREHGVQHGDSATATGVSGRLMSLLARLGEPDCHLAEEHCWHVLVVSRAIGGRAGLPGGHQHTSVTATQTRPTARATVEEVRRKLSTPSRGRRRRLDNPFDLSRA